MSLAGHILGIRIFPAPSYWLRLVICCLLSIVVISHAALDASASQQAVQSNQILEKDHPGHDATPTYPKPVDPCAYLGSCAQAVPPVIPLLHISAHASTWILGKEDRLSDNALSRHFRPPCLRSQV